eukprot:Skav203142  [mRNA]  locus=scaffold2782:34467:36123:+ [translate_table: standard]
MMACCGHKILISPFAAVGSIGVISGIPNAVERLDREGLKVIQTTAGKWKRTIDPFQAPTPEACDLKDVNRIYRQFSGFVKQNRPNLDIEAVATGEVWFGADALEKGLVDELQTSSEYILQQIRNGHEVLEVTYKEPTKGGLSALTGALGAEGAALLGEALRDGRGGPLQGALQGLQGALPFLGGSGNASATALSTLSTLAALEAAPAWPKGVPEPRVEAPRSAFDAEARLTGNLPEI